MIFPTPHQSLLSVKHRLLIKCIHTENLFLNAVIQDHLINMKTTHTVLCSIKNCCKDYFKILQMVKIWPHLLLIHNKPLI